MSEQITRWCCAEGDGGAEMWRAGDGEYVLYSDHIAQRQRLVDALKATRLGIVVLANDNELEWRRKGYAPILEQIDAVLKEVAE